MKKFIITIEEHLTEDFEVEAVDYEEAMKIAKANYKNGKFVLEPGNLHAKLMSAVDTETGLPTEWEEF